MSLWINDIKIDSEIDRPEIDPIEKSQQGNWCFTTPEQKARNRILKIPKKKISTWCSLWGKIWKKLFIRKTNLFHNHQEARFLIIFIYRLERLTCWKFFFSIIISNITTVSIEWSLNVKSRSSFPLRVFILFQVHIPFYGTNFISYLQFRCAR